MATDKQVDKRLQKTYGISKAEYDARQEEGCAVCGRHGKTRGLHVDHDHSVHKVKVASSRIGGGWDASAEYKGLVFYAWGRKKVEAVQEVRHKLKRASVRGLLCFHHNRGLQLFQDNPGFLENAAKYLRKFEEAHG